jgi:hypothetical protein
MTPPETLDMPPTNDTQLLMFRLGAIEQAMRELTKQVGRLVVIEERQSQTSGAIERAFAEIKAQDARIKTLELDRPTTARTNVWVERALIAAASGVGMAVLAKVLI